MAPNPYPHGGAKEVFTARRLAAVTPSDSTLVQCRAIFVGGAGNLSVLAMDDTAAVTLTGVVAGQVYPIAAMKIMAATTATNLVALY